MVDLKGKTVVITGASRGIGEELVYSFAKYHCNVILLSRNIRKLKKIISKLPKFNNQYYQYYKIDVSNEKNVNDVFKQIVIKNDSIDILINNAGIADDNLIVKMHSKQLKKLKKLVSKLVFFKLQVMELI